MHTKLYSSTGLALMLNTSDCLLYKKIWNFSLHKRVWLQFIFICVRYTLDILIFCFVFNRFICLIYAALSLLHKMSSSSAVYILTTTRLIKAKPSEIEEFIMEISIVIWVFRTYSVMLLACMLNPYFLQWQHQNLMACYGRCTRIQMKFDNLSNIIKFSICSSVRCIIRTRYNNVNHLKMLKLVLSIAVIRFHSLYSYE